MRNIAELYCKNHLADHAVRADTANHLQAAIHGHIPCIAHDEQLAVWHDMGINMISAGAECGALTRFFRKLREDFKIAHTDR